jgi:UDPglucose--hexose-1-phosphate uridylyltransferase
MEETKIKSEIREDKIHDRFVIIAPGRAKRPQDVKENEEKQNSDDLEKEIKACAFCPDNQKDVPALYLAGNKDKWQVKVIKNIFPAVTPDNDKAYGYQEVVIETPQHGVETGDLPLDHWVSIIEAYINRTIELSKDKRIKYILIFKNKGGKAGASLRHAHSQIFAAGFTPPHIVDKLTKAQQYRIKNGNCYYCDLIKKEEKGPRLIMADDQVIAFTPYASIYEYEAWIIPRKHLDNITLLDRDEIMSLAKMMKAIVGKLNKYKIAYNMYLHQAVTDKDEHFYIRICPRRSTWAGVEMGSRMIINTVSPEEAAEFYRQA